LEALESDKSTTVTEIEPTTYSLIDVIRSVKEIVGSENSSGGGFEFGDVDPNLDPELALALKLSLEEEQARVSREQQQQQKLEPVMAPADEDEEMARAIELSMQQPNKPEDSKSNE
jgi:26S proteasome regulatory subunit N10